MDELLKKINREKVKYKNTERRLAAILLAISIALPLSACKDNNEQDEFDNDSKYEDVYQDETYKDDNEESLFYRSRWSADGKEYTFINRNYCRKIVKEELEYVKNYLRGLGGNNPNWDNNGNRVLGTDNYYPDFIDVDTIMSMIFTESSFRVDCGGASGKGLMGISSVACEDITSWLNNTYEDPYANYLLKDDKNPNGIDLTDPNTNIRLGIFCLIRLAIDLKPNDEIYLESRVGSFNKDKFEKLVLASYNHGVGSVKKAARDGYYNIYDKDGNISATYTWDDVFKYPNRVISNKDEVVVRNSKIGQTSFSK